jgi:hypothetical protein
MVGMKKLLAPPVLRAAIHLIKAMACRVVLEIIPIKDIRLPHNPLQPVSSAKTDKVILSHLTI